jgi:hypothetical protein
MANRSIEELLRDAEGFEQRILKGLQTSSAKWRHVQNASIEEWVALSLGYEPGQTAALNLLHEYRDRLFIARRNLLREMPGPAVADVEHVRDRSAFNRSQFVAVADTAKWQLPADIFANDRDETAECETPLGSTRHATAQRRDILSPAIEKAIAAATDRNPAAVFAQLRELALGEEPPFTGQIDGDALCYTDVKNRPAKLTRDALGKRLLRSSAAANRH